MIILILRCFVLPHIAVRAHMCECQIYSILVFFLWDTPEMIIEKGKRKVDRSQVA